MRLAAAAVAILAEMQATAALAGVGLEAPRMSLLLQLRTTVALVVEVRDKVALAPPADPALSLFDS
jgi:hypothetical protein